MFESSLQLTLEKFQWLERNLPRYIADRLFQTLDLELTESHTPKEIIKSAVITDIIYAVVKNANWHTSLIFQNALKLHLEERFSIQPEQTIFQACELLGNSSSDQIDDADTRFLMVYLLAWQEGSPLSEKLCGLSHCYAERLRQQEETENPKATQTALWLQKLKESGSLWKADELRLFIDLNPYSEPPIGEIGLFKSLLEIVFKKENHPKLAQDLAKIGIIFALDPDQAEYGLTREGECITARYVIANTLEIRLIEFQNWCETWQRVFFNSDHPDLLSSLQAYLRLGEYPKIGAIPDYIQALRRVLGSDTAREVLLAGLESQESAWVKAALLASGKHLLNDRELPEAAASLLQSPSDTIQRVAADILFS